MTAITFSTALVLFVNLWLLALIALSITVSAISLRVIGTVNNAVGGSVTASIVCAAFTILYLIIQTIYIAHISRQKWQGSWLSTICVQFPRVLIASWVPATVTAIWAAFRQSSCEIAAVKLDAAAWRNGTGCLMFRVLVSLDVVMLILVTSYLTLLELHGRFVPLGLLHFEYTSPERGFHHSTRGRRRSNIMYVAYGNSVEYLASPMTITSEDEDQLTGSAEKGLSRNSGTFLISPSPTYRTLDLATIRDRAPSLPSILLPRHSSSGSFLDLSLSRNSTSTNVTLSNFPVAPTTAGTRDRIDSHAPIFPSSQLLARPLSASDLPALPTPMSFHKRLTDLHPIRMKISRHSIAHTNFQSSSGLPLTSPSALSLPIAEEHELLTIPETTAKPGHVPVIEILEKPAPAWCSNDLKSMPLSADPAIRRLTEVRRNSKPGLGVDRTSRRISLSEFKFGFAEHGTMVKVRSRMNSAVSSRAVGGGGGRGGGISAKSQAVKAPVGPTADAENTVTVFGSILKDVKERNHSVGRISQITKSDGPSQVEPASGSPVKRSMDRKHPTRHAKKLNKSLSIVPPPTASWNAGQVRDQSKSGHACELGKSMVERGRYEKLPR